MNQIRSETEFGTATALLRQVSFSEGENESIRTQVPGKPDDLFLCCSSFESRTLNVVRRFHEYSTLHSIFVVYRGQMSEDERYTRDRHAEMIESELSYVSKESSYLLFCERSDPNEFTEEIERFAQNIGIDWKNARVTVDISTLTKRHSLLLLRFFHSMCESNVRSLYTVPLKYPSARLTRSVTDVHTVPYFTGSWTPGKKTLLIGMLRLGRPLFI